MKGIKELTAQKNHIKNVLKSFRNDVRVLKRWLGAPLSGPPTWGEMHRDKNHWREDVEEFAKELPGELSAKLNMCALSHDGPGWLLCRSAGQPVAIGGSLLVLGAGWGRQMELLQHEFFEITIVEKNLTHAEFLEMRFQEFNGKINVCLLSDLDALKELCIAKSFDTVFIRGDFIREWSNTEIENVLKLLSRHLPEMAEFVIETWDINPIIRRTSETILTADFRKTTRLPPTCRWWQATFEKIFKGAPRLYNVQGPHWCARAYIPRSARVRWRDGFSIRDYFISGRYANRLGTTSEPSAVLMVYPGYGTSKNTIIDAIIATSKGTDKTEKPNGYRVSGRGTAMVCLEDCGPVFRIPLTPQARTRCEIGHQAIKDLHHRLPSELKSVIPTSTHRSYSPAVATYSELLMPGAPGAKGLSKKKSESALIWLANFHTNTFCMADNPESIAGRVLQDRIVELIKVGDTILEKYLAPSQHAPWIRLKETLLNPPWESGIALCMTHGDFHIGNLLFTENELTAVIDWETAASPMLPIRDLFWFYLSCTIDGQHATASVYEHDLLAPKPPIELMAYYEIVDAELWRSLWHPWCRIVYPLERLKTVWDGYNLSDVVKPSVMAKDWINLIGPLANFQERENLLRIVQ